MTEFINWIYGAAITVITVFGRYFWSEHQECRRDRKAIWTELNDAKQDLSVFKGCQNEPCGAVESMKRRQKFGETFNIGKK